MAEGIVRMKMSPREFDAIAVQAINPKRFIVRPPLMLRWHGPVDEEVYWEMYHGRALDQTMTRRRQAFRAWNISVHGADEPLISVKLDGASSLVHVTRAVLCHAHTVTTTSANVVEVTESTRWIRELVGTIKPSPDMCDELSGLVFQAVVGTGRLPLTSQEAPIPAFTFGQLGYFPEGDDPEVAVKRLEFSLRCGQPEPGDGGTLNRLKQVFLGVSLSPYTDFVANVLQYLRDLERDTIVSLAQRLGFLCYLLRLQWRHLNAYDLITFHHRGANYPDALLVDEVLRETLSIATEKPQLFAEPLVRRGLRLGWLLRLLYHDHLVPEQPTSPGENQRVLPEQFGRVPDEQIANPYRRPRKLFDEPLPLTPNAEHILSESLAELSRLDELRELGSALILDRPLGVGKSAHEPDRTPLMSHVARSRKLAARTIERLAEKEPDRFGSLMKVDLSAIDFGGVQVPHMQRPARPGVVAIDDVCKTADDFHVVATTRGSMDQFRHCFDWSALPAEWLDIGRWHVILPLGDSDGRNLRVYNQKGTSWLELQIQTRKGFVMSRGVEIPAAGLRAIDASEGYQFMVLPAIRLLPRPEPET
jgi:hypothetical protein